MEVVDGGQVREAVKALVESLLALLPDCVNVVEDDESSGGSGTTFSMTPWAPNAAPIVINCIESEITLIVGKDSRFEFLIRDASERRHALERLRDICEAVIAGRFSEIVWSKGGEVIRVDGQIDVGPRSIRTSSRYGMSLFSRKDKRVVHYAPYCSIEEDPRSVLG